MTSSPDAPSAVTRFIRGVAVAVVGSTSANLLIAFGGVLIARALGVGRYGSYTTLMASIGLLSNLLGLGLDTWLIHHGSRQPGGLLASAWQVLYVKFIGAVLVIIAIAALAWSNSNLGEVNLLLGCVAIIFDGFTRTGLASLRARMQNLRLAILEAAGPALFIALFYLFTQNTISIGAVLLAQATGNAVILAAAYSIALRGGARPKPRIRELLRMAWVFIASDMVANIYSLIGIAVLGAIAGGAAAGLFKPALSVIAFTYIVPNLMFSVGLPLLNRSLGDKNYGRIVAAMTACAFAYGIAAAIALLWKGDLLISTIFGAQYVAALPFVHLMSLIPLLKAVSYVCAAVMLSRGQQMVRLGLQAVVAVVSLASSLLLIPHFAAVGAAWSQIIIELMLLGLYAAGALWSTRRPPLTRNAA
ncbi:MAG: oligosaccharide flippase family protein [Chloroflexi bacterium]|nr:oligosaccharide flippase family protein [Chloroflexota bacterium]